MNNLRIFFVGGVIAYRALFNWLNPWIFIPTLVFAPIFQVLFFAFLGRSAGLESDRFYVIGNAL
jgi:ABC-2 type transport system permease protein